MLDRYFDQIHIINLATRPDRRHDTEQALEKIGLSYEHPSVILHSVNKPDSSGGFPNSGARGCFESHLNVLTKADQTTKGPITILEDDILFADDFSLRVEQAIDYLSTINWSIFYGGHQKLKPEPHALARLAPQTPVEATHFICVNKPAIAPILAYLSKMIARPQGDPMGGPMHVDGAYGWFRKDHPECAAYAAHPPLGVQRSSPSDITKARLIDKVPGLRRPAQLARALFR